MKAIVNVHKESLYSKYNGLTFPVVEILNSLVALNINGVTTDFTFNEVTIVDYQNEIQRQYNDFMWGYERNLYDKLKKYGETNGIFFEPDSTPKK